MPSRPSSMPLCRNRHHDGCAGFSAWFSSLAPSASVGSLQRAWWYLGLPATVPGEGRNLWVWPTTVQRLQPLFPCRTGAAEPCGWLRCCSIMKMSHCWGCRPGLSRPLTTAPGTARLQLMGDPQSVLRIAQPTVLTPLSQCSRYRCRPHPAMDASWCRSPSLPPTAHQFRTMLMARLLIPARWGIGQAKRGVMFEFALTLARVRFRRSAGRSCWTINLASCTSQCQMNLTRRSRARPACCQRCASSAASSQRIARFGSNRVREICRTWWRSVIGLLSFCADI